MNNPKHTPGPWTIDWSSAHQTINSEDKTICNIHPPTFDADEEDRANARLIAAAPEMLNALDTAIQHLSKHGMSPELIKDLKQVYDKARGEK